MSESIHFEQKSTDEIVTGTFRYGSEIGTTTISGVVITPTVFDGVDASPGDMIQGAATISAANVLQLFKSGVAGVKYRLHCLATLDDGRKLARDIYIEVTSA